MRNGGSVFGGRFRVATGGAAEPGALLPADDLSAGGRVWLVLVALSAQAEETRAALERERRFAVGISGLGRVLAAGRDGELSFFACAAGSDVRPLPGEPWPPARVAALAERLARALAPLHDQGIAHGCLRPEFVVEAGDDALLGFGIASVVTAFGVPGEASQLVPPTYRAPELRRALLAPTPASDVYALGALLHELAFGGETSEAPAAQVIANAQFAACLALARAPEARERPRDLRLWARELTRLSLLEPPSVRAALPNEVAPTHVVAAPDAPGAVVPAAPLPDAAPRAPAPLEAAPLPSERASASMPSAAPPSASFAPPSTVSGQGASILALVAVFAGFLLMIGGVGAALIYAAHHHPASVAAKSRHLPAGVVGPHVPHVASPPPVAGSPSSASESDSAVPSAPAPEPRAPAPLLPPGVGPSVYPEEARAALPITGNEPIWGTRNAPLTLIVFGDLQCPYTRRTWRALEVVKANFGDDLRLVFRHRPLRDHPYALDAARVLAGLQARRGPAAFFAVLHRIARDETELTEQSLTAHVLASGYADSLAELSAKGSAAVSGDLALAGQFALKSTPISFLNGQRIEGEHSAAEFGRWLRDERRSATWALASGATPSAWYGTRTKANLIGVGDEGSTRTCVPLLGSPVRGPADAFVTMVEFSDFECPFCKQVEPTIESLLARYPHALRLVWKDYPLPQHPRAHLLANFIAAARSAGSDVGFWALHDAVFASDGELDDNALSALAGKNGLDGVALLSAASARAHESAIRADVALGERLGVNGTPTFFLNGRRVAGAMPPAEFDALIRSELATAERLVAHGIKRDRLYSLVCDGR